MICEKQILIEQGILLRKSIDEDYQKKMADDPADKQLIKRYKKWVKNGRPVLITPAESKFLKKLRAAK